MGCGAGKGSKKQTIKSLYFIKTGVSSLDNFLGRLNELIDSFAGLVDPLDDLDWRFQSSTGFWWVKNAGLRESLLGMFLCIGSAINGQLGTLEVTLNNKKPFIKGKFKSKAGNQIDEAWDNFDKFADDLEDVLTYKLPEILENALSLVGDIERVSSEAKAEIENLSGYEAVKAGVNLADAITKIPKVPQFMKQKLEEFKAYIADIKEVVEYLRNTTKWEEESIKCAQAKKTNPVDCYRHIYGEPKPRSH